MNPAEITALLRMLAYLLAFVGIVVWARQSRQPLDRLGSAVLISGVLIAVLAGFAGGSRDLEGILRMPHALLIAAYVLTRQRGLPPFPKHHR